MKYISLFVMIGVLVIVVSCGNDTTAGDAASGQPEVSDPLAQVADGRYRGIFGDSGQQQVSVQFDVVDGAFSGVSFRHLQYRDVSYRNLDAENRYYPVWAQHLQIAEYLDGKPLEAMLDLYTPGEFVEDVDAYSGATVRANKIVSAIRDGINRGIYSPRNGVARDLPSYPDGRYRGIFGDSGQQQVSVQFDVVDGAFNGVSFRHLQYRDVSYRNLEAENRYYPVWAQHLQIAEYLQGKPLDAMFDLYTPADFVEDVDAYTGATVRANKIVSAIRDGLNRGIYSPRNGVARDLPSYDDGRYRGIFGDSGQQQISVQFNVVDGAFSDVTFRHLQYRDVSYRNLDAENQYYPVWAQHLQIAEHLQGKPLEAMFDLYTPGEFVEDVDAYTGATVRANKIVSAIRDGLNRGIY